MARPRKKKNNDSGATLGFKTAMRAAATTGERKKQNKVEIKGIDRIKNAKQLRIETNETIEISPSTAWQRDPG